MKDFLFWGVTFFSIIGVILNIKKKRLCFLIWIVTNTVWMVIDFYSGLYQQAFLYLIYLGLAIHGFIAWRIKK